MEYLIEALKFAKGDESPEIAIAKGLFKKERGFVSNFKKMYKIKSLK